MSPTVTPAQMTAMRETLLNTSGSTPLHERFRALFMLKAIGSDEVVKIVSDGQSRLHYSPYGDIGPVRRGFADDPHKEFSLTASGLADPSPLLKHELAYVLGQMRNPLAIPTLEAVLINEQGAHCSMVRHEAAEALGALSSQSSLPLLRKYLDDPAREVRETCEVAVGKIEWDWSEEGKARKAK